MRGGRCNGDSKRREEGEKVAREKERLVNSTGQSGRKNLNVGHELLKLG